MTDNKQIKNIDKLKGTTSAKCLPVKKMFCITTFDPLSANPTK